MANKKELMTWAKERTRLGLDLHDKWSGEARTEEAIAKVSMAGQDEF